MFRGIVEGTGVVRTRTPAPLGERLEVELAPIAAELVLGQSVAIDGVCLTVVAVQDARVAFDLAGETLRRTHLGELAPGDLVNYERAMRLEDRIDGHLVQGHVDGVGRVRSFERRGEDRWLEVEAPPALLAQMVEKGSVALDGISLTIAELSRVHLACTIVPHTLAVTKLARTKAGDRLNVECDVLIKWLAQLARQGAPSSS
jgi:riboflavin synthase